MLLALNVTINVRQQRELRLARASLRYALQSLARNRFTKGDPVGAFAVTDAAGREATLTPQQQRDRLLVVVDPNCDSCARTAAELNAEPHRPPTWVVSISNPDTTHAFAEKHALHDVYSFSPRNDPLMHQKFRTVPQIVRLRGGLVAKTCERVRDCL